MARECPSRKVVTSVVPAPAPSSDPVADVDLSSLEDVADPEYFPSSASEPGSCSGDEEITRASCLVQLTSALRKRSLSESHAEFVGALDSGEPVPGLSQPSLGGSQPSLLSDVAEPSDPEPSDPVPSVSRSVPPRKKKKPVDLPPSGFSSQVVADVLSRPYRGILPRTSYAYVCPDAVKPEVPVVMDFGYLTRSVVADDCSFELDRFVKYVHRKFSRVVASPLFGSDVVVSVESLPAGSPAKFPGQ